MADAESSGGSSQYLESLSGDAAERITAMKWARYLGAAFGPSGALSALRYYARIDWISEDVRRTMVDYVRGLTIEELELSEVEPELHGSLRNLADTEFERHARSLQFVAAISGRSIEHGLASLQLAESLGPGAGGGHAGVGAGAAGQPPSMGATGGPFVGGNLAPGEQAEMAAGGGQRQRDRQRRDERSRRTSPPGEDGGASPSGAGAGDVDALVDDTTADISEDDEGDGDAEPADEEANPIEVSMADVTPGSIDRTDETDDSVEDGTSATEGADEAEPTPEPEAVGEATDPEIEPEIEPAPEPSPGDSSLATDGVVATFDDGNIGTATETESDGEADDERPPEEDRCIAITRDGDRCSRSAADEDDYCHQHAPEN